MSWREWGEATSEQRRQAAAKGMDEAPEQYCHDLISNSDTSADTHVALDEGWIRG